MIAQTSTQRAILEHDTMEEMSSSIKPKRSVNKEPSKLSASASQSGESTFNVSPFLSTPRLYN